MKKKRLPELIVGELALKMLKWAGDRARFRGDDHESAHCYVGILAAMSNHSGECVTFEVNDVLKRRDRKWERFRGQAYADASKDDASSLTEPPDARSGDVA